MGKMGEIGQTGERNKTIKMGKKLRIQASLSS
jgi:hypothetical protein